MNAVVTTLLCSAPDPQRGEHWQPDGRILDGDGPTTVTTGNTSGLPERRRVQ